MSEQPSQSLATLPGALELVRKPTETLADAQSAASALMSVISRKPKKLMFNGEQYLEVDDWETIGAFHGCTADIEWTRPISIVGKDGLSIVGWEARATLKDRSNRELSHAEAMCMSDEEKWADRPKYAWVYITKDGRRVEEDPGADHIVWVNNPRKPGSKMPKKERVQVGNENVPQFQLRSMAQTRAIAKVHSNVFRWVAALAGYKGTPAEELPVEAFDHETGEVFDPAPAAPVKQPQNSTAPSAQTPEPQTDTRLISEAQGKRLFAIARASGWTMDALKDMLFADYQVASTKQIERARYNTIIAAIEQGPTIDTSPDSVVFGG